MSFHVFENFFSRFSGKGAKRKRKVSECLHDVFLCIKNLALVIFFHYATKEISQWKLTVTLVFFLKTKGKLAGKIVPNGVCLCLSTKQKSPVETLKNFQNVQKSRGLSRTALFSFQLEANRCCYGCRYAPINVKPTGGRQGIGWGFDRLCWPWGRAFD